MLVYRRKNKKNDKSLRIAVLNAGYAENGEARYVSVVQAESTADDAEATPIEVGVVGGIDARGLLQFDPIHVKGSAVIPKEATDLAARMKASGPCRQADGD